MAHKAKVGFSAVVVADGCKRGDKRCGAPDEGAPQLSLSPKESGSTSGFFGATLLGLSVECVEVDW